MTLYLRTLIVTRSEFLQLYNVLRSTVTW